MERPQYQISVAALLGVVACVALNIWLFRVGTLLGLLGLNVSKHVVIAYLCQVVGVDRKRRRAIRTAVAAPPAEVPVP